MDYDTASTAENITINGAISIYGKGAVGDNIQFYYNDELFNIRITEDDQAVYIECAELGAKGMLWEKFSRSVSYFLREAGTNASSIIGDGTSENVVGTCRSMGSTSVGVQCACGGENTFTQPLGPTCYPGAFQVECPVNCLDVANDFYPPPIAGGLPSFSTEPCTAFSIKDKNSNEHSGPVDNGWTRYGISNDFNNPVGGESVGLECGAWDASFGRGTSCCGDADTGRATISYSITNCHYTFTMIGRVLNGIIGGATLNFTNPPPVGGCYIPQYDNVVIVPTFTVQPQLCDCNRPDSEMCFGAYRQVNCELYTTYCSEFSPDNTSFSQGCAFAQFDPCCKQWCGGSTFPQRQCLCLYQSEEKQTEYFTFTTTSNPGVTYEVVETTNTGPSDSAYTADCNKMIATIVYDNEILRINVGAK
ncbi:hypothetical protein EB077_13750, partial [bacterium]|nr:hypothetical protein [bacterium]